MIKVKNRGSGARQDGVSTLQPCLFPKRVPQLSSRSVVSDSLLPPGLYSTPGSSVLHYLPEFKFKSTESVILSNHLILYHPFILLPSVFPSISVFSELALLIRWPQSERILDKDHRVAP